MNDTDKAYLERFFSTPQGASLFFDEAVRYRELAYCLLCGSKNADRDEALSALLRARELHERIANCTIKDE
jgi:hypothetical protein